MREFSVSLKDFKGLRPTAYNTRNSAFLTACTNIRFGEIKIEPYTLVNNPGLSVSSSVFPFNQILVLSNGMFWSTDRYVYKRVGSTDYLLKDFGSSYLSHRWTVADFGPYQVWTSGKDCLVLDAETAKMDVYPLAYTIASMCNFNGQLIAGGFDEAGPTIVA